MNRLMGNEACETLEEEREALRIDLKHLQKQCVRYGCEEGPAELGGLGGLLFREKTRLFNIYHSM